MMQTIKVIKSEQATTTGGKPYKKLEVECEGEVRKVNMWSNFPDFANIKDGSLFEGKMEKGEKYWNLSHDVLEKPKGNSNYKSQQIEKAVERKEAGIAKSQDNKEWGIKVSSTMRDAVQLAIIEYGDKTVLDTLEQSILKWREWLWRNWDVEDTQYPPF